MIKLILAYMSGSCRVFNDTHVKFLWTVKYYYLRAKTMSRNHRRDDLRLTSLTAPPSFLSKKKLPIFSWMILVKSLLDLSTSQMAKARSGGYPRPQRTRGNQDQTTRWKLVPAHQTQCFRHGALVSRERPAPPKPSEMPRWTWLPRFDASLHT